ncbi:hypothetical protein C8R47DRAFT_1122908 [Mycena vitilis]|nr:hypothetical protein C8R47DRAFT_1122908 [Mycena vitilis]
MFSELLKLTAHSLPSVLYSSFVSTVSNILPPSGNVKKDLLVAVVSSSRVTGVPIRTTVPQIQPGVLDVGSLVLACLVIMLASGSAIWVRSPAQDTRQYGRIRKEESPHPPPPPPPPPPAADEFGNENAGDDGPGDMNDGDGDDDPQKDVGTDGQDARPADGLVTATAPAPEDPPPPPNDIEEDDGRDDDDDVPVVLDSLPWIFLVLLALLIGKRPVPATTLSYSPPVADALEPTLLIQGLLQRPLPPISIGQEQSFDPQVFKQAGIAVVAGVPSAAPIRRRVHWLLWRNTFAFLVALPALVFLLTIVRLLLPPGTISRIFNVGRVAQQPAPPPSTVAQVEECEPQSPAAPDSTLAHPASDSVPGRTPTDLTDPAAGSASSFPPGRVRAFITLEALLAGHPAPLAASEIPAPPPAERDVSTQEKRNRMVSVLRPATATRMARHYEGPPEKTKESREKNDRVRAVQREIWAKMRELRLEGAVEDGPHA